MKKATNEQLEVGTVKRAGQQHGPRSFLPAVSKFISVEIVAQVDISKM
jgi:hypothetical protein